MKAIHLRISQVINICCSGLHILPSGVSTMDQYYTRKPLLASIRLLDWSDMVYLNIDQYYTGLPSSVSTIDQYLH